MLAGKKLYALIAAALSMAAGGVSYSYMEHAKKQESFFGDGYVLTLDESAGETTAEPVYFNAGTKYKVSYPETVSFKDTEGNKQKLDYTNFVHYADGSIGAVTDGVLMELEQLKNGYINYYNVSSKSIMRKENDKYILDNKGEELEFKDFIWKLSDSKYLVSSNVLDIVLPNQSKLDADGFVELNYLDDGIVQILTDNAAYQVLTSGTEVTLANGMSIDTDTRMIDDGDDEIMSLSSLQADNASNIFVVPSANQAAMNVPKFDITTIDGVDGETGVAGEEGETGAEGETGEEGKAGEEGQTGEEGKAGEEGQNGDEGEQGTSGKSGENGSDGKTGAGGSGGSTGGTAGSGNGSGSGSGGSNTTSGTVMPVVRVEEFHYDSGSVSGKLSVEEGSGVTLGTGTLWITDLQTGEKVSMDSFDLEEAVELNFDSSRLAGTGFHIEAGKEYQITLEADYTLDRTDSDGNQITGSTNLFTRTFSTNALGITESYDHATTSELYVKVEKAEYSSVQQFRVVYQSVKQTEAQSDVTGSFTGTSKEISLTLDHGSRLEADTEYNVKLYARNPNAVDASNVWELVSTHTYKTLKQSPEIGGKPIVALSPRGYFEIKPGLGGTDSSGNVLELSDPNNGIRKYRYEIYTIDGELATTVENDSYNPVSVYIDGTNIRYNVYYKAKLVVEFFDNEKIVEYATGWSDNFMADSQTGVPYMMFESGDLITDKNDPRYGQLAVRSESFDGTLKFYFNNANLAISPTQKLRFTIYSEAFIQEKEIFQTEEDSTAQQTYISIPLTDMKGLRANTTYRFNAYGYYKGDTSETLLATCIVNTTKPGALTVHMVQDTSDLYALSAKLYFTDANNEDAVIPFEAYTMRQLNLSLYEGINKRASAVIKFDRKDPNNEEYSGAAAYDYFGLNGENYYTITNTTFKLSAADINNSTGTFTIAIDDAKAYDYTIEDSLRYGTDEAGNVLGSYGNEIPLRGETEVDISPTDVAPAIPTEGMQVVAILNSNASDFGFSSNYDLPEDAVIGFVLSPQYDNTGGYANRADYYIFDKYEYETYIAGLGQDAQKDDPLANASTKGKTPLLHYSYDLNGIPRSQDGMLPKLIVLMGEDPHTEKQDHYTIEQEGRYQGVYYIYADSYNPLLQDANTSGTIPKVERGRSYYFPYDVNLTLNKNKDYRYPYEYVVNGGADGSYVSAGQIMKNRTAIDAQRAKPQIEMYPYEIWNSQYRSQWKMKIFDPDGALDLKSFYSRDSRNVNTTADFQYIGNQISAQYKDEEGNLLLKKYLADKYKENDPWLIVDFTQDQETGDKTNVALQMDYNALYKGERDGERKTENLVNVPFLRDRTPAFNAKLYIDATATGTTDAEKEQATIAKNNALIFTMETTQTGSMEGVTAIAATVSAPDTDIPAKTEFLTYSYMGTSGNNEQYQATLPLTDIKEFMGHPMSIILNAYYESGAYGYKEGIRPSAGTSDKYYALMTANGNYRIEQSVDATLVTGSTRVGSIYKITNFEMQSQSWKRTVNFHYQGQIYNRSSDVTMNNDYLSNRGFKWGDDEGIVFRPLAMGSNVTVTAVGSLSFNTLKPTISKANVDAGLTSAKFTFDLTDGIASLLAPNSQIQVKIIKRDGTKDEEWETIYIPVSDLDNYRNGISSNSYVLNLGKSPFTKSLEKNTQYFIQVSGVLKDSTTQTRFLDSTGAENNIEFNTLDSVVGTAQGGMISNRYYQDKFIYGRFGLNTTVGLVFRYDVYEFDNQEWLGEHYTEQDLAAYLDNGRRIYSHKELRDNGMFTDLPEIYSKETNLLSIRMWPTDITEESRFKPGKYYGVRVRAYAEGTEGVYDQDPPAGAEVLGDFMLSRWAYQFYQGQEPAVRVTNQFTDTSNLASQKSNLTLSVADPQKYLVSDYRGIYSWGTNNQMNLDRVVKASDPDGDTYTNNGKPDQNLLQGLFMVRIYEAQYAQGADGNRVLIGYQPLDNDTYFENTEQNYNTSWSGRTIENIQLKNLKENTEYKVAVYGVVDTELSGNKKEINETMLNNYLSLTDPAQNQDGIQKLSETTFHTLDSTGIYIDEPKMEVEQVAKDQVAIYMYNSAGLNRVAYVEVNFVQEDLNEDGSWESIYTGMIDVNDSSKLAKLSESGSTMVDTWTLKGQAFQKKGRYRAVIKYYGADNQGNADAEPMFSTTKYFRVTIPTTTTTTTSMAVPGQSFPVQQPLQFRLEEERKKIWIG